MTPQSKTAELAGSTVSNAAWQGGSMSKPCMEMTMETNNTAPSAGAMIHTLQLSESRQRPLNPGEPIKFDVTMDGQPVVTRSYQPMLDACRVLQAWGYAGKARFVPKDGNASEGMTWDIEVAAKLSMKESGEGVRFTKYVPADASEPVTSGRNADALTIGKVVVANV